MNEDLKLNIRHSLVDSTYLVDGKFTGQDHTPEAEITQPADLLCRTVIGLGTGVELQ